MTPSMLILGPETSLFAMITASLAGAFYFAVSVLAESDPSRHRRWEHVWIFRKNAAFVCVMTGILFGAALNVLRKLVWRCLKVATRSLVSLVMLGLANAIILGPLAFMVSQDTDFMDDMKHVFDYRKNVVVSFAVAGVIVQGLAIHYLSTPSRAHKAKMD